MPSASSLGLDSVTVIVPVKDEEEAIGLVIDELLNIGVKPGNIIVVDGHSRDRTPEIARSKGVVVVTQPGDGKADAVRHGLSLAKTDYVLIMDGDYTYPAKHIPELLSVMARQGCGEVIGARLRGRENIPLVNRLGNWLLTKTFNLLFGTRLRDVLSGMYLVRKELLEYALFETKGFSIESEIAAHIASIGEEVCEHPIEYRRRIGAKKLRVIHGLTIFLDMIKLSWSYNPFFTMALVASLLLVPGLVLGSWVLYEYYVHGVKHHVKGIAAIMMGSIGLEALLIALMALYTKRAELRLLRAIRRLRNSVEKLADKL